MDRNLEIQGYGIIVIQALPVNEKPKTGQQLYDDIIRYKSISEKLMFTKYYDIQSAEEFRDVCSDIELNMPSNHIVTLHLETHGCEEGIVMPTREIISWKELFSYIRPLNVMTSNLLIVTLAMCKGAAITSHIEPMDRAPFRAFIGFVEDMYPEDLIEAYTAFYSSYNNLLDIREALKRMLYAIENTLEHKSSVWCFTSEDIFERVLMPAPNQVAFQRTIKETYGDYQNSNPNASIEEYEVFLRNELKNMADKYRAYYNFKD